MKRILLVLIFSFVMGGLSEVAMADSPHAHLTAVRVTHPPVHRHKAHKAGKHKAPKHRRHRTV
jgi:hypothetical protein